MPSPFVFTIVAPEGAWRAHFFLEPGQCYGPGDVTIEQGRGALPGPHTLTVTATHLPSEAEFRELAARAATRTADASPDPFLRLLHLLIPF